MIYIFRLCDLLLEWKHLESYVSWINLPNRCMSMNWNDKSFSFWYSLIFCSTSSIRGKYNQKKFKRLSTLMAKIWCKYDIISIFILKYTRPGKIFIYFCRKYSIKLHFLQSQEVFNPKQSVWTITFNTWCNFQRI